VQAVSSGAVLRLLRWDSDWLVIGRVVRDRTNAIIWLSPEDSGATARLVALDAQAGREEALAHKTDLVIDLALLPARRRRAGDKMVRAHLEEATIVLPIPGR
jgi:hypothetical protein